MDNDKALNNVKAAIGLLEQLRKEMETPPPPAFKRGDISVEVGCFAPERFIHDGAGRGRWVKYPDNLWTPDSREEKKLDRFATRAEWEAHFPGEPYPYAPTSWGVTYNYRAANIRKSTTGDGWLLTMDCVESRYRTSLHHVKAIAAEKLCVPDDVDLKWKIVE